MHKRDYTISYVEPDSLADDAGILPGDKLVSVNGEVPCDILEYRYLISEPEVRIEIQKTSGDTEVIDFENDYEDLGIEFCQGLLDTAQSCQNKCIFCFIDQLPKGMRETVYFKDDDARLSFMQGNYVTLTNMSDDDIDRLIRLRISPINISVHTTNPDLRKMMLSNRFAGNIFNIMKKLSDAKIYMNCQIVLCPGINDKSELDRTISDLATLIPYVQSVSVVPVGLTAYRDGLYSLTPFDAKSSLDVIYQVAQYQKKCYNEYGTRFVYLSDEFYINAKMPIPKACEYEGFPQIENGVGLVASLEEEFCDALLHLPKTSKNRKVAIATGELAKDFITSLTSRLESAVCGLSVTVFGVKNNFFGGGVNVAGLVCACDILKTIPDASGFDELLIPDSMLRDGEDIFLDNITLSDLEKRLNIKITPVPNDGYLFVEAVTGLELEF